MRHQANITEPWFLVISGRVRLPRDMALQQTPQLGVPQLERLGFMSGSSQPPIDGGSGELEQGDADHPSQVHGTFSIPA